MCTIDISKSQNRSPRDKYVDVSCRVKDFNYGPDDSLSESNLKDNRQEEVPHIAGQINNDLYAIPVKRRPQKSPDEIDSASPDKERSDDSDLPPGWEKHEGVSPNYPQESGELPW